MTESVTAIQTYEPQWYKIGDLTNAKLISFMEKAPYAVLILSIMLMGTIIFKVTWISSIIGYFAFSLIIIYVLLRTSMNNSVGETKMGQLSLADIELKKPKRKRKKIYYFAKFGTVVKNFDATTPEEAREIDLKEKNIKYDYILSKAYYTMHILLAGTTGAGKTVSLISSVIEPCIKAGSGFIYIEGKGDRPISRDVYALFTEHGREDDIYFLDFGAVTSGGFSHSIAPLANGGALVLAEALTNLIDIMTGDNSWVSDMATEFMLALLFPLVIMRDLDLMVNPVDLRDIETLDDFEKFNKIDFNLTTLSNYLSYQAAIDLVYVFRNLFRNNKFKKMLRDHQNHKSIQNYEQAYLQPLLRFLENRGIDVTNEAERPDYLATTKADAIKQNNYAINSWTKALTIFGNEAVYGRIFNKEYPDINILDAMRRGKSIIISLPSMQNSSDKNEKIGRMMTSLIKAALGDLLSMGELEGSVSEQEAMLRFRPYKVPYMMIFDEISNYGNEMMGQLASMIRSVGKDGGGMGMVLSGQSFSDLKKIGDGGHAGEQLQDNMGIAYFLNISGTEYPELAEKYCGTRYVLETKKEVMIKRDTKSDKAGGNDVLQSFDRKEEPWFKADYFTKRLQKQSGEAIVIHNGFYRPERMVSNYRVAVPFHNDNTGRKVIILSKPISHKKLLGYFNDDNYIKNTITESLDLEQL